MSTYSLIALLFMTISSCGSFKNDEPTAAPTEKMTIDPSRDNSKKFEMYLTSATLPGCDGSHQGSLYYVSSESNFYSCDSGSNYVVKFSSPVGQSGSIGPQGPQGNGRQRVPLSSAVATAVGSLATSWTGTAPSNLGNFIDQTDDNASSISNATTATTAGSISATASVSGCIKVDLQNYYQGQLYGKVGLSTTTSTVGATLRWEFSPDNYSWYIGNSATVTLTTTSTLFYPSSDYAGRYIALCVIQPATGMQSINFTGYQLRAYN